MKDSKNAETENTSKEVVTEVKVHRKPDIDKIIEDRRKALLEGKTINK